MSPKKATPAKLNRARAVRLSAIEGMRLSPKMKATFAEFDAKGVRSSARRAAIKAQFKAQ